MDDNSILGDGGFNNDEPPPPVPDRKPEEVSIGSVKLVDDGIVVKKTLTGFEQNKTYADIPADQRFSDHALILYPSQGIGTFNIAFQAKNTKNPGTTHYAHKFPMEVASPVNETPEMYNTRLLNILNLCKAELDKGRIYAIVFQEALAAIDAVYRTAPFDKKPYGFLRNGEFCIFYKADAGKFLIEPTLIPDTFTNNTGMKAAKFDTLKESLEKKITVYRNAVKKQLLFNVHIPGLDLKRGPVKQRQVNTLKLLTEIQTLYAAKPEFNGFTAIFVGDFNVPLIGETQENSDIFQTIPVPMEIHTTLGNEGFSYTDHNRTRTTGNIDCLVKVSLASGGGAPPRPPVLPPIPNTNNTTVSDINSIPTENREENEDDEPVIVPIPVDINLPTILRIGNGGKFDEFINVTEKTFTSLGGFQILHKGGQKELQRLYSVRDGDRLVAMQKAFGVRRLSDKPPIMSVLEQGCTPDYSTDAIDQALESRISTLEAELGGLKETTQKGMKRAFLKVLQDLLDSVRGLPEDNPCPTSTKSDGPGPGPGSGSVSGSGAGSTGCPCLDDLDLLRDLVMLVVTLMGIASPQVKAQLEAVRLDDILGLLNSGNSETATVRLREILQTLGDLEVASGGEAGGETIQAVLRQLWDEFSEQPIPDPLTVPILIAEINSLIKYVSNNLNESQRELRVLHREIAEKEEEIAALERQLAAVDGGREPLVQELAQARINLTQMEAEHERLTAQFEELTRTVRSAEQQAEQTFQDQQKELTRLRGELATAEVARTAAQQSVRRLEDELAASQAETGTATAERDAAVAEKNALTAKVKGAIRKLMEITNELQKVKAEKNALEQRLAAGDATVQGELTEKNRQITDLTRQVQECNEAKAALEAQLAQKETEIAALTARAEGSEKEIDTEKAKVTAAAGQVAALEEQLASVRAKLAGLEERYTELIAATEAKLEEYNQKMAAVAALEPSLRAQIAALEESGAAAEQRATEAEAKATRLEAELRAAQKGLDRATQEHAAEKADAEAQKRDLTTKLTELEGRIRATEEAADAITSQDSAKDAELAQLRADKASLQAQLDALTARGPEQEAALAAAKAEFDRQIKECQDALAALRQEKNSQLAAKNAELEQQRKNHEQTIAGLRAQIAEAEGKAAKAETNAQGEIAKAQQAAAENRNTKVKAAENKAKAAEDSAAQELERFRTDSAAKNAEITELKQKLADAQKAQQECEEELAKKKAELDEIGASLPQPGEIEAQAVAKAAEMRKQEAEKETAAAKIAELEGKIIDLETTIAGLQASSSEETEIRLNTLLSVILIDTNLQEAARKFMKSGDQTDLEPLKAKKTDLGIVSDELCDFFTYLYGVVRLQKKSILNKLHNSGIEEPYISDIFTMYEADPSSQWHTIADKDYLTEFSIFLQHFFGSFDERMGLPGKGLKLTEEYPELHHFITTRKLKDDPKVRKLLSVLPTFDLLSKLYIVATDSNTLTVTTSKPSDDSSKYLNFAIFAIKYIQVVYNFIREKSESLLAKCKVSPPVAAPPKEEQKGGSDEIEFEEFTL